MPSELGLKAEQDFARLAKWWENGGKLHRVCESPQIICKILGVCDQLGRGSIFSPDSQRVMSPKAKITTCIE